MISEVSMSELDALIAKIKQFSLDRNWEQFHAPKNVAMALSVEVGELLEEFQWLTCEESEAIGEGRKARVRDEVGDVFIYLLDLCDRLGIDPVRAAEDKMVKNAVKYPVQEARGNARKYAEF